MLTNSDDPRHEGQVKKDDRKNGKTGAILLFMGIIPLLLQRLTKPG